jgi:hypothetical protein
VFEREVRLRKVCFCLSVGRIIRTLC